MMKACSICELPRRNSPIGTSFEGRLFPNLGDYDWRQNFPGTKPLPEHSVRFAEEGYFIRGLSVEIGLCNSAAFAPTFFRVEVKAKEFCTISINKGIQAMKFLEFSSGGLYQRTVLREESEILSVQVLP